jgi:hypothetical protein
MCYKRVDGALFWGYNTTRIHDMEQDGYNTITEYRVCFYQYKVLRNHRRDSQFCDAEKSAIGEDTYIYPLNNPPTIILRLKTIRQNHQM